MVVSTFSYSPEVLQSVGRVVASWHHKYLRGRYSRLEFFAAKEFRLLIQYLIINEDPNPLDPDPDLLRRWLEIAHGLDVSSVRRLILDRMFELTGSPSFQLDGLPPAPKPVRLDWNHLLQGRQYHRTIYERSRPTFDAITTERVLDAERKSLPFYDALDYATDVPPAVDGPDCFEESWIHVTRFLERELATTPRPHRILDVGCGHAQLIGHLRRGPFHDATLVGTNLSGAKGIRQEVLDDPNIEIVQTRAEDLPFESESFDAVVSTEVIEHLVQPRELVEQIVRVLKPGGVYIVTAPSVHHQFLSPNPLTYLEALVSLIDDRVLPPFHNLYEPLTDLPLIHHAFSVKGFAKLFREFLPETRVSTMRFPHLRKFRIEKLAPHLPWIRNFGGLVMAHGRKPALVPGSGRTAH